MGRAEEKCVMGGNLGQREGFGLCVIVEVIEESGDPSRVITMGDL